MGEPKRHRKQYKAFNDPVHGTILLHPLLVKIVDTPEFQRLRNIKQLGAAYYVYPGAQHNRFEHSIGTAHLAGKLVRHLQSSLEEEKSLDHGQVEGASNASRDTELPQISDKDVLCVEIAGLCHDLGHGPFSHLFDGMFMPRVQPNWTHEEKSCEIFDAIMKTVESDPDYDNEDKLDDTDKNFVKELINGGSTDGEYLGRPSKTFLYEIISNKVNGVDVDKWDYFARDCHHLGIANGFDHNRFIQFMKVIKVDDGKWHLCARDKEIFNLYEMFHMRFALYKRAYQHRVKNGIEHMISDAMVLANDELKISASAGKGNTTAYTRLDDGIFQKILYYKGQDKKGKEARKILERVVNRNLYEFVADEPYSGKERDVEAIRKKIAEGTGLSKDDMAVSLVKFNYGSGDKDPIQYFWFYKKNKNESGEEAYKIKREEVSKILPNVFEEYRIQVFSKNSKKTEELKRVFKAWIGGKEKK